MLGPVTLLAGTANATTIELKGQWVLRVTADGKTGSVSYGPQGSAGDERCDGPQRRRDRGGPGHGVADGAGRNRACASTSPASARSWSASSPGPGARREHR